MSPEDFMQAAIAQAEKSETPFGAVIVKDGEIVEQAGNTVEPDNDPSAHAEVNVMRKLTARMGNASLGKGYTLYTTCEPCAMCAATAIWAGVSEIVYGTGVEDFADSNPNLIEIRCESVVTQIPDPIPVKGGVLRQACRQLHERFPLE
ncbi:MAG: nucleoside deaminase [Cyanobacteria bacterium P01_A01_bin.114]